MKKKKVTEKMIEMAAKVETLMNVLYMSLEDIKFLDVYKYDGIILVSYKERTAIIHIRENKVEIKYRKCDQRYIQRMFELIYEWDAETNIELEVDDV